MAVCISLGFGLTSSHSEKNIAQAASRPNIILILTDDLDTDSIQYMPRLKSLMTDQGVFFDNAFVTNPLCCPSRSTILRGQYSMNHGVVVNYSQGGGFTSFHGLGRDRSTVATWLRGSGYRTALFGKYLTGYGYHSTYVPPGWNDWYALLGNLTSNTTRTTMSVNGKKTTFNGYETDVLGAKAGNFIRDYKITKYRNGVTYKNVKKKLRNGKKKTVRKRIVTRKPYFVNDTRPFFMYLAPTAPHYPSTPAPRHAGMFPNLTAPRPPSFNEEDVSDKPEWVRNASPLSTAEKDYIDEYYRKRARSLQAVDEMIRNLVRALSETGKLDNTYIIFTSDNGLAMGEHRKVGKRSPYEESIRVPMIVRGPEVPAGQTREQMVLNNDLAPTIASLAGVSTPAFVDGRSFQPLMGANPPDIANWRSGFLVENFQISSANGGDETTPSYKAVRTRNNLYVDYVTGERELYDLNTDPYELDNIHDSADPALVADLKSRLDALKTCAGALCRTAENEPPAAP